MALSVAQKAANAQALLSGMTIPHPTVTTAVDATPAASGDAATDLVIENIRTRLGQVIQALTDLGLVS